MLCITPTALSIDKSHSVNPETEGGVYTGALHPGPPPYIALLAVCNIYTEKIILRISYLPGSRNNDNLAIAKAHTACMRWVWGTPDSYPCCERKLRVPREQKFRYLSHRDEGHPDVVRRN